jgi:rSAM/selenodomain-associated transferase 1
MSAASSRFTVGEGARQGRRVLGLFAKLPVPGAVKTRLAAETCAEWAAQVAEAFLLDTLDKLAGISAQRVVAFAPADAEAYFSEVVRGRFELVPQVQGDLGKRMAAFFTQQLAAGADKVVLTGADSPSLPADYIERAFAVLEQVDVVLGPATDGGYYLVGLKLPSPLEGEGPGVRGLPPIFDNIPWSSDEVLTQTVARLVERSWSVALLPPWYDVDTLSDWQKLQEHVTALERAGTDPGLPNVRRVMGTSDRG